VIDWWLAAAAMTLAVLIALASPLLRRSRRPIAGRSEYDISVFRDQLAEIDRDVDRGVISAEQAEAARIEVKRRILAAADKTEPDPAKESAGTRAPALAAAIAFSLPVLAVALYFALGVPNMPDFPFAERGSSDATGKDGDPAVAPDLAAAVVRLEQRLREQPDDLRGWALLGRSYMTMNRFAEAAEAFRRAVQLSNGDPELTANHGEARVAAAGGTVDEIARQAFTDVLAKEPRNPKARFYLAQQLAQQGDFKGAVQGWSDLIALSPPASPWLPMVRQQLSRAAAEADIDPVKIEPSPEIRLLIEQPPSITPVDQGQAGSDRGTTNP
jgi:cytochrome c-type biogenesis protein CcmH